MEKAQAKMSAKHAEDDEQTEHLVYQAPADKYAQGIQQKKERLTASTVTLQDRHHTPMASQHTGTQRSVRFSHTMVIGGLENEAEPEPDIDETNEDFQFGQGHMSPINSTSGAPRGSDGEIPVSIDAADDKLDYQRSSFLSARDSLELALKKRSLSLVKVDSPEHLKEMLLVLTSEIDAGKLDTSEMRLLTSLAQTLLSAPDTDKNMKADINFGFSENFAKLINDINANHISPAQLSELSLALFEHSLRYANENKKGINGPGQDNTPIHRSPSKNVDKNCLLNSAKSHQNEHHSSDSHKRDSYECRTLISLLRKLKVHIILAPGGGFFAESIEKVVQDVAENIISNLVYDAMVITICLILSYQQCLKVHAPPSAGLSAMFGNLAEELIVLIFEKVLTGVRLSRYRMEDLIRITSLIGNSDNLCPDSLTIMDTSCEPSKAFEYESEAVFKEFSVMKNLIQKDSVKLCDLIDCTHKTLNLQTKYFIQSCRPCDSIWVSGRVSRRFIKNWSLLSSPDDSHCGVEVSYITHFRLRIKGLREVYQDNEILYDTADMTESALDILAVRPEMSDYWAACLVLVAVVIFEQIKSQYFTSSLDYKVLDSLMNTCVIEAFNVGLKRLEVCDIDLSVFKKLNSFIVNKRRHNIATTRHDLPLMDDMLNNSCNLEAVVAPNSIIDFLHLSLDLMKKHLTPPAAEIKAIGDYCLNLQLFYAQKFKTSTWKSNEGTPQLSPRSCAGLLLQTQEPNPDFILEHIDKALDVIKNKVVTGIDLMSLIGLVLHLIEIPERMFRNDQTPPHEKLCDLREFERRLLDLKKITAFIPKFDFVIKNIEKSLCDLNKCESESFYHHFLFLTMCIPIIYCQIRTKPLSMSTCIKMSDRAAYIVYEVLHSTFNGIQNKQLPIDNLIEIANIISSTSDLRGRPSTNNGSFTCFQDKRVEASSDEILVNDTVLLDMIENMLQEKWTLDEENVCKLQSVLMKMQDGGISGYLYQLLLVAFSAAASRGSHVTFKDNVDHLVIDHTMEHAIENVKAFVDGIRSGNIPPVKIPNLIELISENLSGSSTSDQPKLDGKLEESVKRGMAASDDEPSQSPNSREGRLEPEGRPEDMDRRSSDESSVFEIQDISDQVKLKENLHKLEDLVKASLSKLVKHISLNRFSDDQLQCLLNIAVSLIMYSKQQKNGSDTVRTHSLTRALFTAKEQIIHAAFTRTAVHHLLPEAEAVKEVELHAMMGKRPLHVSSDFLSESLSAISLKPDGKRRYSYKSLINPDVSKVEALHETPEKAIPRRLSLISDHNVAAMVMSPIDEEEKGRRRASLPTKDLAIEHPLYEDDDEDEEWQASCQVTNINDLPNLEEETAENKPMQSETPKKEEIASKSKPESKGKPGEAKAQAEPKGPGEVKEPPEVKAPAEVKALTEVKGLSESKRPAEVKAATEVKGPTEVKEKEPEKSRSGKNQITETKSKDSKELRGKELDAKSRSPEIKVKGKGSDPKAKKKNNNNNCIKPRSFKKYDDVCEQSIDSTFLKDKGQCQTNKIVCSDVKVIAKEIHHSSTHSKLIGKAESKGFALEKYEEGSENSKGKNQHHTTGDVQHSTRGFLTDDPLPMKVSLNTEIIMDSILPEKVMSKSSSDLSMSSLPASESETINFCSYPKPKASHQKTNDITIPQKKNSALENINRSKFSVKKSKTVAELASTYIKAMIKNPKTKEKSFSSGDKEKSTVVLKRQAVILDRLSHGVIKRDTSK